MAEPYVGFFGKHTLSFGAFEANAGEDRVTVARETLKHLDSLFAAVRFANHVAAMSYDGVGGDQYFVIGERFGERFSFEESQAGGDKVDRSARRDNLVDIEVDKRERDAKAREQVATARRFRGKEKFHGKEERALEIASTAMARRFFIGRRGLFAGFEGHFHSHFAGGVV